MKILKLLFILSAITVTLFIYSCESTVLNNSQPEDINFTIPVWDYSDSYYFLDTLYKRSYLEVSNVLTGFVYTQFVYDNAVSLMQIEVWIQCDSTINEKRVGVSKVMLGVLPVNGYDTSITKPENIQGEKYFGYFRKLNSDEYVLDRYSGFIGLQRIINPDNLHIGVAYKTQNGNQFGKGLYNSNSSDTLILKLIKVDFENPFVAPLAWELKMKNVYRLPVGNLTSDTKIYLKYDRGYPPLTNFDDTLPGYSTKLITMLKLDRITKGTSQPPPDGLFDWYPEKTINPQTGDIFFPILRPFSDGLVDAGMRDSTYNYNEIYTHTKVFAQISQKAGYYYLRGKTVQSK